MKHFHQYLVDRNFTVQTDHAALTWLQNFKSPEGQLAQWLGTLQDYQFKSSIDHGRSIQAATHQQDENYPFHPQCDRLVERFN